MVGDDELREVRVELRGAVPAGVLWVHPSVCKGLRVGEGPIEFVEGTSTEKSAEASLLVWNETEEDLHLPVMALVASVAVPAWEEEALLNEAVPRWSGAAEVDRDEVRTLARTRCLASVLPPEHSLSCLNSGIRTHSQ